MRFSFFAVVISVCDSIFVEVVVCDLICSVCKNNKMVVQPA